jgi:hypothetical protein
MRWQIFAHFQKQTRSHSTMILGILGADMCFISHDVFFFFLSFYLAFLETCSLSRQTSNEHG